jgi:ssRNA-specific RNase YbeY (16S rRNA maturation enzyme)
MEILIKNSQSLPVDQKRLTETAEKMLMAESCPESSEVSILLIDDEGITKLNRE